MWNALKKHHDSVADRRFIEMVDGARAEEFSATTQDMRLDYAKTNIDADGRDLLIGLLDDAGVGAKRDAMFSGAAINETEGRAVLHTALRNLDGDPVMVDGEDVMPGVLATLDAMSAFASSVRDGSYEGQGGKITDVVNIGIGGSDLGPAMAVKALAPYHDGPRCHFVSNVDPADVAQVLRTCDPATTLVIVASKTFTTIETMTNARTAKASSAAAWHGMPTRARLVSCCCACSTACSTGTANGEGVRPCVLRWHSPRSVPPACRNAMLPA